MKRRIFIKITLISGTILAASAVVLAPARLLAAWNKAAFQAKDISASNAALGDKSPAIESQQIQIEAPDIAENSASVPIKISTDIKQAEAIRLYIDKNPTPLIATFQLTEHSDNFVFIRAKIKESSSLIAVVKANGQLYTTQKAIKVTQGGCGG